MRKTLSLLVLTLIVAVVMSACGAKKDSEAGTSSDKPVSTNESTNASTGEGSTSSASDEITIKHPLGSETLKKNPAKVVVFDYGTLDTLDKLGVEVAAVPKSSLPEYLAKYKADKYEDAGTLFEPDFEKLNKLKPDVIFIGGRTGEAYAELKKIAPTIQITLDYSKFTESFTDNVNKIAQLFFKETEAANEVTAFNNAAQELKSKAANAGKALIVLTTGGKISAYGPGSRFGVIHDVFGYAPADDKIEASNHGQSISNEYIAEKNPDVLFVIDRDAVAGGEGAKPAKEVIENDLVKNTNAFKNGKIVYLDPGYWYLSGGGLLSNTEMVKEAAQAVQ